MNDPTIIPAGLTLEDWIMPRTRKGPAAEPPADATRSAPSVTLLAVDRAFNSFNLLIKAACVLGVAWLLHDVLIAFAGKSTSADVFLQIVAKFSLDRALLTAWGAAATGYGLRQRQLRRDAIQRLSEPRIGLERSVDSHRTSSGLTSSGTTHPKDR